MSHLDLHLHLLPGVDDGPTDLAQALDHAHRMAAAGVREATVTPHVGHPSFPFDHATVPGRTRALQVALRQAGIPLRVRPGGEIHPAAAHTLSSAELDLVAQGPRGGRWVLAEVPFAGIDDAFLAGCARIRGRGFGLVIAHPERAAGILDGGLVWLERELAAGSVLQVNVCSLLGRHGPEAQAAGELLVRERLAYLLASDGHAGTRSHTLAEGVEAAMAAGASAAHADQLTRANPRFLLHHGLSARPITPASVQAWRGTRYREAGAARAAMRRLRGAA